MRKFCRFNVGIAVAVMLFAGCAVIGAQQLDYQFGDAMPRNRILAENVSEKDFYRNEVKPILDRRCVVCHACYEAPCQLVLSSPEGVERGANVKAVYSGTRLLADQPTRLFIDHHGVEQWREHDFFAVFNERQQTKVLNKDLSVFYQHLLLKQKHPLPETKILNEEQFDFSLNKDNICPKIESFEAFSKSKPLWGMPYGFPAVSTAEMDTLTHWIESGAWMSAPPALSEEQSKQIERWENFLNQPDKKHRLVARYIYEHLFLADLYFDPAMEVAAEKTYFRLVRSITPPGEPINIVASRRPSDNPGEKPIYYRLQRIKETASAKNLLPYLFDAERMRWMQALFFEEQAYDVKKLPGYGDENLNPFITFEAIPANIRYRFLLQDAEFFIGGFIKGPVCRGQIAVDVINDHFWVFFVNPDNDAIPMLDGFLERQEENLRLPGSDGSNAGVLSYWTTYSELHKNYLLAKAKGLNALFEEGLSLDLNLIWDGDQKNSNAALTVFRHFDNASVVKGLVGRSPKTAWVIDYPLFERIHYLLTVDFDVFGNIGHQLNTRLYMDFLRIEGEYNFLSLLPLNERFKIRDHWYRGAVERLEEHLHSYEVYLNQSPAINYKTNDSKNELYGYLKAHLNTVLDNQFLLSDKNTSDKILKKLESLQGGAATFLPEVSTLLLNNDKESRLYTIITNKAHSNITSLLSENENLLPEEDSISVAPGIIGDYPNIFLKVNSKQLHDFVEKLSAIQSEQDYRKFLDQFGVRRTSKHFWQHSDQVHNVFKQQLPDRAALLDYGRYENR